MKIRLGIVAGFPALFLFSIFLSLSQANPSYQPNAGQINALEKLKAVADGPVSIHWNERGVPAFLTGNFRAVYPAGAGVEATLDFLGTKKI